MSAFPAFLEREKKMIEAYSNNLSVNTGEAVTFNNTSLKKGCTAQCSGATIQLNRCGIYQVNVNATALVPSAQSSSPADVSIELRKNGMSQPEASAASTAASETEKKSLSMTALVQVPSDNGCGPCSSPTTCSVVNSGAPATFENINIVVTKLV